MDAVAAACHHCGESLPTSPAHAEFDGVTPEAVIGQVLLDVTPPTRKDAP